MSDDESTCLRWLSLVLIVSVFAAWASPGLAQTCTVPGSHATIQTAMDDPACTTIDLSAQTYAESVNIPLGVAKLPRTGQATCYDASGTIVVCTGTGQDGQVLLGVVWPTLAFRPTVTAR